MKRIHKICRTCPEFFLDGMMENESCHLASKEFFYRRYEKPDNDESDEEFALDDVPTDCPVLEQVVLSQRQ